MDFCFADGSVLELSMEAHAPVGRMSEEQYPTMVPEDIGMPRAPMSRSSSPTLLPDDMEIDEEDFETPVPRPLGEHPEPTIIPEDDDDDEELIPPPSAAPRRMRGPFGGSVLPAETAPLPVPIIKSPGGSGQGRAPAAPPPAAPPPEARPPAPTPSRQVGGGIRIGRAPAPPAAPREPGFDFGVRDARPAPVYHQEEYRYDTVGVFDEGQQDPDERPTEIDDGHEEHFGIQEDEPHYESMPAAVPFDLEVELEPEPAYTPTPAAVPTPHPTPAPAAAHERPSLARTPVPPSLSSNPPDIRVTRPREEEESDRTPLLIALAVLLLLVVIGGGWWASGKLGGSDPVADVDDPPVNDVVDPVVPAQPDPPENTEPENTEPENTEPENTEPENTEPENTEPENGGTQSGDGVAQGGSQTDNQGSDTPPKPTTGVLAISVTPSSAMILVDGKEIGAGTANFTTTLGAHTIVARADGYSTVEKRVVLDGSRTPVSLKLDQSASSGVVKLFGTPGSQVFLGDKKIESLPATITLPEGSYTFRVVTPSNVSYTVSKTIRFSSPGKPVNISLMPD